MISSGQPVKDYIDSAVRHVLLRQVCLFFHRCLIEFRLKLGFHALVLFSISLS